MHDPISSIHADSDAAPRAWLLAGPRAGDNNQVLALGEMLGWPFEVKQVAYRRRRLVPKAISSRSLNMRVAGVDLGKSSPLAPPWPDVVISAGREQEPAARWIKLQSGGRTRLVHMGRPWAPLDAFDLIISTPQYALPERDNILLNLLPLHRVTPERLQREAATWRPRLGHLQGPYTAVMLGGNSGSFTLTREKGRRLGRLVDELVRESGGSLLVTDSARTPAPAFDAFIDCIGVPTHVYRWGARGADNPYFGYLALADRIVITGESVSMLAEASVTAKPMMIFDLADTLPEGAPLWQRAAAKLRYHALREWFALRLGPRYMQRDIGMIQRHLVDSGRARWIGKQASQAAPRASAISSSGDAERAVAYVRRLFAGSLPC
ncbi:MAG: mitochondrial fission ELM1 family protein [Pseudomonadales bacterium]|nr:mitochondrial fission ELM1 family protein [Pseudomonadales bacterium]